MTLDTLGRQAAADLDAAVEQMIREGQLRSEGPARDPVHRLQRRLRVQRLVALTTALAISALALGLLVRSFRSEPVPADRIDPQTVIRLEENWRAPVGTSEVVASEHLVLTWQPRERTILGFDPGCDDDTCSPIWSAVAPEPVLTEPLVTEAGIFVASGTCSRSGCDGRLIAYPIICERSTCAPMWYAGVRVHHVVRSRSTLVASHGLVFGGIRPLEAFPLDCRTDGGECRAVWSHRASWPPAIAGDILAIESARLLGYSIPCIASGGPCEPLWRSVGYVWRNGVRPTLIGDGIVVGNEGFFGSYAPDCRLDGGRCRPTWTVANRPDGGDLCGRVVSTRGVAVRLSECAFPTTARGFVAARVGCGAPDGRCPSRFVGLPERDYEIAAADGVVYVSGGGISAYQAGCLLADEPCGPAWTVEGDIERVIPASRLVFAAVGGELRAYPAACGTDGGACEPIWTRQLGTEPLEVVVAGARLFVTTGESLVVFGLS